MRLRVEAGDAVGRHFDSVVPVARVRGGVQDADVRANTADDQLLRPQFRQPLLQGRVEKRAVALLRQQLAGDVAQLGDHFALGRTADAVRRKDLELLVVRLVRVRDVDDLRAARVFFGQQPLDVRDDRTRLVAAVERVRFAVVVGLQEATQHIGDEDNGGHGSGLPVTGECGCAA